jgi:hypothetical protein
MGCPALLPIARKDRKAAGGLNCSKVLPCLCARTSNHVAYLKPVLSLQARILDLSKALLNIEKYAAKGEKAFY